MTTLFQHCGNTIRVGRWRFEAKGLKSCVCNGFRNLCIRVDRVVYIIEHLLEVKWCACQEVPMTLRQIIEALSSRMGDIEMPSTAVGAGDRSVCRLVRISTRAEVSKEDQTELIEETY